MFWQYAKSLQKHKSFNLKKNKKCRKTNKVKHLTWNELLTNSQKIFFCISTGAQANSNGLAMFLLFVCFTTAFQYFVFQLNSNLCKKGYITFARFGHLQNFAIQTEQEFVIEWHCRSSTTIWKVYLKFGKILKPNAVCIYKLGASFQYTKCKPALSLA